MSETEYSLGRVCAATFAGIKPAGLICVKARERAALVRICGRFYEKGFSCAVLREGGERVLVCIYHRERLACLLFSSQIRSFLEELGYRYADVREAFACLKARMGAESFPHEVGVFLGYPLHDVEGFIADPHGGTPCGAWKAYGDEEGAARTSARWRRCTDAVCRMMDSGKSLTQIFGVGEKRRNII